MDTTSDATTQGDGAPRAPSWSHDIARLTDTITACERLCLLSSRTIVECATPIPGREAGVETFIPSINRSNPVSTEKDIHPTTSAQCTAALQQLLPIMGRFRLGVHESRGPALYPIERSQLRALSPSVLESKIREKIYSGIKGLHEPLANSENGALITATPNVTRAILTSGSFQYLHPITAAYLLRATASSDAIYGTAWWLSLFNVLWYLNRRGSSRRGFPNIQTTASPGTAFLTSKCVDAIRHVLDVFDRRRLQFRQLIDRLNEIKDAEQASDKLEAADPLLDEDLFGPLFKYQTRTIAPEIEWLLTTLKTDGSLSHVYKAWHTAIGQKKEGNYCKRLIDSFANAMEDRKAASELADLNSVSQQSIANAQGILDIVAKIHRTISTRLGKHGEEPASELPFTLGLYRNSLPDWLCSQAYWKHTEAALSGSAVIGADHRSRHLLESLEAHWRRHRDAAQDALDTATLFSTYLQNITSSFADAGNIASNDNVPIPERVDKFVEIFSKATRHVNTLRKNLQSDIEIGAKWAAVLMNRHLRYAISGASTEFDAGELAHALRIVVCASDRKVHLGTILAILNAICAAQRPDGSWGYGQPFHWTSGGSGSSTLSVETASAILATVNAIQQSPEQYGISIENCPKTLDPTYGALDRFFAWLSSTLSKIEPPDEISDDADGTAPRDPNPPLYGWCSDRTYEDGRIHSWATAATIEFLIEFRRLAQERINAALRREFLSYNPDELKTLREVDPTDLAKLKAVKIPEVHKHVAEPDAPVILQLMTMLSAHKKLQYKEGTWLRSEPPPSNIAMYSAIFYGPPGTSKSFLAKAIAGELGWPLLSLSPSDFLTRGADNIEARAAEIFAALESGSRIVYFFDEIDELIRDRQNGSTEQRSAFSLLTPSFLTKLQNLRDAAKSNEFVFILATNYFHRIDSAAKRVGRIDRDFLVMYPDKESRAALVLNEIKNRATDKKGGSINAALKDISAYVSKIDATLSATAKGKNLTDTQAYSLASLCAEFTGPLSHQRISDFLKSRLPKAGEQDTDWQGAIDHLIAELSDIANGVSYQYKPEVKPDAYVDDNTKEEAKAFFEVYPENGIPAILSKAPPNPERLLIRDLESIDPARRPSWVQDFLKQPPRGPRV